MAAGIGRRRRWSALAANTAKMQRARRRDPLDPRRDTRPWGGSQLRVRPGIDRPAQLMCKRPLAVNNRENTANETLVHTLRLPANTPPLGKSRGMPRPSPQTRFTMSNNGAAWSQALELKGFSAQELKSGHAPGLAFNPLDPRSSPAGLAKVSGLGICSVSLPPVRDLASPRQRALPKPKAGLRLWLRCRKVRRAGTR
jgi:hypothetical protein